MSTLKEVLRKKIEAHRPRITKLVKECGDVKLGDVTIAQTIGGARGIKSLVTDISYLDPFEGIRFRGMTIPETFDALPKVPGSDQPYVEGFWYLLLTGDVPTMEQTLEVVADWKSRAQVPQYVFDVLNALPSDSHPMAMFSSAVLAMQRDSVFSSNYAAGKFNKMTCWEDMYEDSNNMMAKLGPIGAYIYRKKYKNDDQIAADPKSRYGRKLCSHDGHRRSL
jgi:citrate synthase